MTTDEILKPSGLAICVIAIGLCVRMLLLLPARLDPQGDSNSICTPAPLPPVAGGNDMEVTAHLTVCSGGFVHDAATYVYLHKTGEQESPRSLMFRYSNDQLAPPNIKWADSSHLTVSVDSLELVTKMVPSFEGVSIDYLIGREQEGRGNWQQQQRFIKEVGVVSTVFALFLLILAIWLSFLIRRDLRARGTHLVGASSSK